MLPTPTCRPPTPGSPTRWPARPPRLAASSTRSPSPRPTSSRRSCAAAGIDVAPTPRPTPPEERVGARGRLLAHDLQGAGRHVRLGMGLDKPDLGFVVHLGAPPSPIAYYQQVGRAGRALDTAEAVLLPRRARRRSGPTSTRPRSRRRSRCARSSTRSPPGRCVCRSSRPSAGAAPRTARNAAEGARRRRRGRAGRRRLGGDRPRVVYDAERYAGIAAARRREQRSMLAYERGESCLMRHLRTSSTTIRRRLRPLRRVHRPAAGTGDAVGRHGPRGRHAPAGADHGAGAAQDVALRRAAARQDRRRPRAEPGRALARGRRPSLVGPVGPRSRASRLPAEVFDGAGGHAHAWGWPAGRPTWVTWVPSRRRRPLLADLATRLASLGRMESRAALSEGPGFQRDAATSAGSAARALSRLRIAGAVPSGPVCCSTTSPAAASP